MEEYPATVAGRKVVFCGAFEKPPDLARHLASVITNGNALEWCMQIGAIEGEKS